MRKPHIRGYTGNNIGTFLKLSPIHIVSRDQCVVINQKVTRVNMTRLTEHRFQILDYLLELNVLFEAGRGSPHKHFASMLLAV